jgi:UrcA family protein
MKNLKWGVLMAAIGCFGFGVAGVATAQTAESSAPKLVLHYSPSSLTTESGVRKLFSRLVLAAEQVCGQSRDELFVSDAVLACRKQAVAGAVAQIHNARLADLSAGYAKRG